MSSQDVCNNCRYGQMQGRTENLRLCRRYPPRTGGWWVTGYFPAVWTDDWCGEYEAIGPQKEEGG